MDYKKEIENDIWFANQLEAIRQMECPHTVDVTDTVMQSIEKAQSIAQKNKRRLRLRIITTAAAACIAGAILVVSHLTQTSSLHASTTIEVQGISNRVFDIYDYCNDYANSEYEESAAYNENLITDLI